MGKVSVNLSLSLDIVNKLHQIASSKNSTMSKVVEEILKEGLKDGGVETA